EEAPGFLDQRVHLLGALPVLLAQPGEQQAGGRHRELVCDSCLDQPSPGGVARRGDHALPPTIGAAGQVLKKGGWLPRRKARPPRSRGGWSGARRLQERARWESPHVTSDQMRSRVLLAVGLF